MKTIIYGILGLAIIAIAGSFVYVATQCPCERIPGFDISGEVVTSPVSDWGFVNETGLCELEVDRPLIPHSITLNCMSGDGQLYISCSRCDGKYWSGLALERPGGRIKVGSNVYPINLRRATEAAELDFAWHARAEKLRGLGREVNDARPDHWWSFELTSR